MKKKAYAERKPHRGLDQLRLALGAAMPDKARKGAFMPKHFAALAGINYETTRGLLNGGLDFKNESNPLYRLIAITISIATGVHPDFQTKREASPIVDVWGRKYTAQTYLDWTSNRLIQENVAGILSTPIGATDKSPGLFFDDAIKMQSLSLMSAVFEAAKSRGFAFELMAAQLIKMVLLGVAKTLGAEDMIKSSAKPNSLKDFTVWLPTERDFLTVITDAEWQPEAPAILVKGAPKPKHPAPPEVMAAAKRLKAEFEKERKKIQSAPPE